MISANSSLAQNASNTVLTLSFNGSPAVKVLQGSVVAFSAVVTAAGAPVSPGQVEFCDAAPPHCTDIHKLGMAQLNASGVASMSFMPPPGQHDYFAVFLGTEAATANSSVPASLTVQAHYPTTTVFTSVAEAPGTTGIYTVAATVTGTGVGVAPTGSVSIVDVSNGNYVLGSASLVPAGTANTSGSGIGFAGPEASFEDPSSINIPSIGGSFQRNEFSAVGDFNGDGKPDAVVAVDSLASAVVELKGNGDGTLSQGSVSYVGTNPVAIAEGDFNGDGKLDLAVADYGPANCLVPISSSELHCVPPTAGPPLPPLSPIPFVPTESPMIYSPEYGGSVTVLLGIGDGSFASGGTLLASMAPSPSFVATGDFNRDGIPDLVVANVATVANQTTQNLTVLLGKGDGTFTHKSTLTTGADPVWVVVGDFNGDQIQDLAVANEFDNTISIYLGKGDGTFQSGAVISTGTIPNPITMAAADLNGDGVLDLVVGSYGDPFSTTGSITVLLGNGDGTFTKAQEASVVIKSAEVSVADFNGDGIPDLLVNDYGGSSGVMLGNGDGSFQPVQYVYSLCLVNSAVAVDLYGGGKSDVLSACDSTVSINLSEVGSQTSQATISNFVVAGAGNHELVASYSGDSLYDPSVSQPKIFGGAPEPNTLVMAAAPASIGYGNAVTLSATVTPSPSQNHTATGMVVFTGGGLTLGTAPVVNGAATVRTTLLPAGVDTVTAVYSGDTNFATSTGSTTVTVRGYDTTTALSASPNPAMVDQPIVFSVTVTAAASASPLPLGSVNFFDGSTRIGTAPLDSSGHAKWSYSTLAAGNHTITAVYSGHAVSAPSTSAAVQEVVNLYSSITRLVGIPDPAGVGHAVLLTATVSGVGTAIVPTGLVQLYDGSLVLDTIPLNGSGVANYPNPFAVFGSHSLQAVYLGDSNFVGGSSPVVSEQVVPSDFTITLSSPNLSVAQYSRATTTVTLASIAEFGDNVALQCGAVPTNVTCSFAPTTAKLDADGSATVTLTIDTNFARSLALQRWAPETRGRLNDVSLAFGAVLIPLSWVGGAALRRRKLHLLALLLTTTGVLSASMGVIGCGGNLILPIPAVSPGTYQIPVTATGKKTGTSHNVVLTLTVDP